MSESTAAPTATPTPTSAAPPAPGPTPESIAITQQPGTSTTDAPQTTTPAAPQPGATPVAATHPAQPTQASTVVPVEQPEPQSALTEQFTVQEWEALKQLRTSLPDILADGYPDNPKARETPITLWGVHIDPANPIDARVSVVLMKFLRARNLSVRDARAMLTATLRWRDEFNVDAAVKEVFPQEVFGQVGHIYGRDKGGRPIVYNLYGANKDIKAVFGDVQRFLRWRVALMEQSLALLDFTTIDQTVQIHDYEGVSLTSRDANSKNAASEATSIFQSHYPELLHKKFFVNVPTLLNWIFWVFKPLISANTLAKMTVVGSGKHEMKKALLPVVDVHQLPKRYGGEANAF